MTFENLLLCFDGKFTRLLELALIRHLVAQSFNFKETQEVSFCFRRKNRTSVIIVHVYKLVEKNFGEY